MSNELRLPLYNPSKLEDFLKEEADVKKEDDERGILIIDISPKQDNEYDI